MFTSLFGKKPNKVYDINKNIENIKDTIDILNKKCKLISKNIDIENQKIQSFLQYKNKNSAILCLKRKKMYETQLQSFENQIINLESMIFKIEESVLNKETVKSIITSQKLFNDIEKEMDISKVEVTIDKIQDSMQMVTQISDILSTPLSINNIDDDELLEELNELENDPSLPQIVIPNSKIEEPTDEEIFKKLEMELA